MNSGPELRGLLGWGHGVCSIFHRILCPGGGLMSKCPPVTKRPSHRNRVYTGRRPCGSGLACAQFISPVTANLQESPDP